MGSPAVTVIRGGICCAVSACSVARLCGCRARLRRENQAPPVPRADESSETVCVDAVHVAPFNLQPGLGRKRAQRAHACRHRQVAKPGSIPLSSSGSVQQFTLHCFARRWRGAEIRRHRQQGSVIHAPGGAHRMRRERGGADRRRSRASAARSTDAGFSNIARTARSSCSR